MFFHDFLKLQDYSDAVYFLHPRSRRQPVDFRTVRHNARQRGTNQTSGVKSVLSLLGRLFFTVHSGEKFTLGPDENAC